MNEAAWDEFSRGSSIRRATRAGFLRNVAVALGNWVAPEAVPALVRALEDPEPLVRGHAAWALGRISSPGASERGGERGGTGSGLAIARQVLLAHGGAIGVDSGRGPATVFTLPAVEGGAS